MQMDNLLAAQPLKFNFLKEKLEPSFLGFAAFHVCLVLYLFLSFLLETVRNILFIHLMLFHRGFYFILCCFSQRTGQETAAEKLHGTPAEIIVIKKKKKKKFSPKSG